MSRHAAREEPQERAGRDHLAAAGLAAVATPALALAAQSGRTALLVGIGLLQALLVVGWVVGTGLPGRIGGLLIGTGVAGAADAAIYLRDRASLAALLGVLGLSFPAMVLHQLSRGVVRVRVTESLSGVAALSTAGASAALVAGGVGLVTGRLLDIVLPVPRLSAEVPHGLFAVGAAIALGGTAGAAHAFGARQLELGEGALLGSATAGVAALVAVGVGYAAHALRPPTGPPLPGRSGAVALTYLRVGLPLALTGPVAYLLGLWAVG